MLDVPELPFPVVASQAGVWRYEPDDALTGPIMRGDAETVGKHLRVVQGHGVASEVYRALSAAAIEIARRRGVDAKKLLAVSGLLRSRK